ncbi:hypothetical protein Plec18167_009033 [Paecilomyces lecythidis]|uniref:Casein kinase substrate phosphoprotein PP28 domain-containing protein n=1 Tax=Paecilomyces lecythidis TaxID=3004212 RepID=A0ABR3WT19_9EURO
MAPRGRGGKFSKPSRGGGKHFSRDVQPTDKDGNAVSLWREPEADLRSSSDEEEDEESGSEEESSEEDGPSTKGGSQQEVSREQRRALAKAKKEAAIAKKRQVAAAPGDLPPSDSEEEEEESDGEMPANPNHTAKSRSQAASVPASAEQPVKPKAKNGGDLSQLSRREREAIEAQQARERYLKLHAEGKTEEARADLARLAIIRERREAEKARKQAEKEEEEERKKQRAEVLEREKKLRDAAMGPGAKKGAKKTQKK